MKGIYLDDYRTPKIHHVYDSKDYIEWKVVRSYNEFVALIEKEGLPDIISFDHDLNDDHISSFIEQAGRPNHLITFDYDKLEKTGYHCAKWLCEYCLDRDIRLPKFLVVHSHNPVGGDNIVAYLRNYCKIRGENPKIYKTYW